jgi:Tfp pilus assembly protein PilF
MVNRIVAITFIGCFFFLNSLQAQDPRLAFQYMQDGEYEKAAQLFKILADKTKGNDYYFNQYLDCLMLMEEYEKCKKEIEAEMKKRPNDTELYITMGRLLERMDEHEKAEEQYAKAIARLPSDKYMIMKLGGGFTKAAKYDLAIKVYERGEKLFAEERPFSYNLADLYRRTGDTHKMIFQYLNSLEHSPSSMESVKHIFQRYLADEDYVDLQAQLYQRVQKDQENPVYPELLAWMFIQRKDYRNALRQVKSIDKRIDDNGLRVYNLGQTALFEKEYDIAISAFDYIVDEKGRNSRYYIEAKKASLNAQRRKITDGFNYNKDDLRQLEQQFKAFLDEFGYNSLTAPIITELADLQAYYLNDLDAAIETLNGMIQYRGVNREILANAKLNLGDFYLMNGDRWEATLLYSQVDKDFGEEILGQEARFRNARLSYFVGDFEWAQSMFNILKAATSRFIANDALDLSVFIMDNLGLDTTDVPLKLYAEADMLIFQNRFVEALDKIFLVREQFPSHKLEDDLLYLEAQIHMKRKEYELAAIKFQKIVDEFPEEIRADNALFALGDLYETKLDDPDKARACFEQLFLEYSSSTFAIDARKRYRILRGDNI